MSEHIERISYFLRNAGASGIRVEMGGKHPRIVFGWLGVERFYVVSGTPRNPVAAATNAIRDIRHMLGIIETVKRVGKRRTHKARAEKPKAKCPTITAARNWSEDFYAHPSMRSLLPAKLNEAFLALWRDCMRSSGGVSRL